MMGDAGILHYYLPQFGRLGAPEESAEDRGGGADELAIGSDVRSDKVAAFFEQHMGEGVPGLSQTGGAKSRTTTPLAQLSFNREPLPCLHPNNAPSLHSPLRHRLPSA